MKTSSKTVNITVPSELLKRVDALAKRDYTSRSDIIRQALLDKLRTDEWGDEGNWETIADFRNLPDGGMPAEELLNRLDQLRGQNK